MKAARTWLAAFETTHITGLVIATLLISLTFVMLPLGTSPLESTKVVLLSLSGIVLLILLTALLAKKHWLHIPLHPLVWPLLALTGSVAISSMLSVPFPAQMFTGLGGTLLAVLAIAILGSWLLGTQVAKKAPLLIAWSGALLAVVGVLDLFKVGSALFYQTLLQIPGLNEISFSPAGSFLMIGQVCLVALVTGLVAATTSEVKTDRASLWAATLLNLLGLGMAIWYTLPGKPTAPVFMPWAASWSIATDVLKYPPTALFGVGPDNFVDAFTRFKPMWLNSTALWNVEFTQARSLPLNLLSTQGLVGLLAWVWLVVMVGRYWTVLKQHAPALTAGLVALLVLQLLFPPTLLMLGWFAVVLAALMATTQTAFHGLAITPLTVHLISPQETNYKTHQKYSTIVVAGIVILLLLGNVSLIWGLGKQTLAEAYIFQANQASVTGNAIKLYDYQQQAINLNPYSPHYHRLYALTNLNIALALSNKTDLTEQDREQVTALISQSIREARLAITLAPQRTQYWEGLGDIYGSLIGTADGAATWATEAYRQSIVTSPSQPTLFVKLGGVFHQAGNYSDAVLLFNEAVTMKADFVAAYYNAAQSFKQAGNLSNSELAYQQTLAALESTSGQNSPEYTAVTKELQELQAAIASSASAKPKTSATTPAASPTPTASPSNQLQEAINPSLSLTEEALENPTESDLTPQSQVELDDSTRQLLNGSN